VSRTSRARCAINAYAVSRHATHSASVTPCWLRATLVRSDRCPRTTLRAIRGRAMRTPDAQRYLHVDNAAVWRL